MQAFSIEETVAGAVHGVRVLFGHPWTQALALMVVLIVALYVVVFRVKSRLAAVIFVIIVLSVGAALPLFREELGLDGGSGLLETLLPVIGAIGALVGVLPYVEKRNKDWNDTTTRLEKRLILERAALQSIALENGNLNDDWLKGPKDALLPVLPLDLPKPHHGLMSLRDLQSSISFAEPTAQRSNMYEIDELIDAHDLNITNLPAYIMESGRGASIQLSQGGRLFFREGKYFESYRACEVPLWRYMKRVAGRLSGWESRGRFYRKTRDLRDTLAKDVPHPHLDEGKGPTAVLTRRRMLPVQRKLLDKMFRRCAAGHFNTLRQKYKCLKANTRPPSLGMGIVTLLVFVVEGRPHFLLLRRDRTGKVGEAVGMTSVVPGGMFQPTVMIGGPQDAEKNQGLAYNVLRELGEEIYGLSVARKNCSTCGPECKSANGNAEKDASRSTKGLPPTDVDPCFVKFMNEAQRHLDVRYLGLVADPLTLKLQMLTCLVLPSEILAGDGPLSLSKWVGTWEGTLERFPFKKDVLEQLVCDWRDEDIIADSIACLSQAHTYYDTICEIVMHAMDTEPRASSNLRSKPLAMWMVDAMLAACNAEASGLHNGAQRRARFSTALAARQVADA